MFTRFSLRAGLSALLLAFGLSTALPQRGEAAENLIGRQSQNEGMLVLPAPGKVTVDGKLDDWDFSGRIWVFADMAVRSRFSTEVAAMWTPDALYIAAKWKDPTPMFNLVDPAFNPNDGWRADSIQMRVRTADQVSWLTTWYYTPKKQPVFHIATWNDMNSSRKGQTERLLVAPEGGTVLGEGVEMAYVKDEDGKGFVQEIRIPWSIIYATPPKMAAGEGLRMGFEFLWGDPSGNTFPIHRYADNMQAGQTSREFYWEAWKAWGDLALVDKGNVPVRKYVTDAERLGGSIPIRVTLPKNAARATFVIEDESGNRVRNLIGDLVTEDYTVAQTDSTRTVEVMWDGLTDEEVLARAGNYKVRGLFHDGLSSEYEMCYYNPGTPPWPTSDGQGAWGADHSAPLRAAQAGDWMIVSWAFAEGGSGIIGIGPDGLKKWGEKRGGEYLAADEQFVYAIPAGWHIKKDVLMRLKREDGAYTPFVLNGEERPFELPFETIVGEAGWNAAGLDAHSKSIVALLAAAEGDPRTMLVWIDKTTGQMQRKVQTAHVLSDITVTPAGLIYGITGNAVVAVGAEGTCTMVSTPGLVQPVSLTTDAAGNVLAMDGGPDQQVKAYNAATGTLAYTVAKKGGRPIRGDFEPQAVSHVKDIAVDSTGKVWAIESWNFPRRVSVWNPTDGSLARDYIGNTNYAGSGTYLHDTNPELAYCGPIEFKLDRATRTWKVTRILWVPDETKGECFDIDPGQHAQAQRFTATVNGKTNEYMFVPPYRDYQGYTIFMETPKGWQPVSAITTVSVIRGWVPSNESLTLASVNAKGGHNTAEPVVVTTEFDDLNAYDAVFWNDGNGDGKVQRSECTIVPAKKPGDQKKAGQMGITMGSGWGERIGSDFVFYTNGIAAYTPLRFTDAGAPVYGPESIRMIGIDERGDLVPVPEENLLLDLSFKGYASATRILGINPADGSVRWKYPNPYPGVHGSHRATMPKPGMVVGPLKIVGIANVGDPVGRVFMMRGNLGQDFLMTTDGLFVGAMFQDGRLPGEQLPPTEAALVGQPMEGYSHGGEPFNGWFGRQDDGKIRMTTGFPRQAAMILAVNGLDSIRRFDAPGITLDAAAIAAADKDNQERAIKNAPPRIYTVQTFEAPPKIDGSASDWNGVAAVTIDRPGFPQKGYARLAIDADNLYVLFDVEDDTPWKNEGKDHTRLFKTGDAVDLQFSADPARTEKPGRDPKEGDFRIVFSQLNGKPVAVMMRAVDKAAPADLAVDYTSPVSPKHFDRVEVLKDADVKARSNGRAYTVEASIPLASLGVKLVPGTSLRGDFGFISSDSSGTINTARTYWANKDTNLVNDLPIEASFSPATWGTIVIP